MGCKTAPSKVSHHLRALKSTAVIVKTSNHSELPLIYNIIVELSKNLFQEKIQKFFSNVFNLPTGDKANGSLRFFLIIYLPKISEFVRKQRHIVFHTSEINKGNGFSEVCVCLFACV